MKRKKTKKRTWPGKNDDGSDNYNKTPPTPSPLDPAPNEKFWPNEDNEDNENNDENENKEDE